MYIVQTLQVLQADPAVKEVTNVVMLVVSVVVAVIVAFGLAEVIAAVVRAVGRRTWIAETLAKRARMPLRAVLIVAGVWIAVQITTSSTPAAHWLQVVEHALLIALIITGAWLIGALAFVVEDAALARYQVDTSDNRNARRIRTQISVLRRITVAALVVCALAGALLTFPSARAAGASVLASAGVISLVAGLAAQSLLGNFFAGVQLAFTDAIRVDDVVVVEGEWGRIEEITMTYVVVHIWDDRRLILPSTHFTTTPFANWTRHSSQLLGTVELDLDWNVPVELMRAELRRLLEASDLWDRRVGVLQVTDAIGGVVRLRVLASALDAPTLFDLRCYLREGLVGWLQREMPLALPRTRLEGAVGSGLGTSVGRPVARPGATSQAAMPVGTASFGALPVEGAVPAAVVPADAVPKDEADEAEAVPAAAVPVEAVPEATGQTEAVRGEAVPVATGQVEPVRAEAVPTITSPTEVTSAGVVVVPGVPGDEPAPGVVRRRSVRHAGQPETVDAHRRDPNQQDTVRLDLSASDSRLFTGSIDAIERSKAFTGPGQAAFEERDEAAAKSGETPKAPGSKPTPKP
jgi:small-conductance mechanosensitive channel